MATNSRWKTVQKKSACGGLEEFGDIGKKERKKCSQRNWGPIRKTGNGCQKGLQGSSKRLSPKGRRRKKKAELKSSKA